MAGKNKKQPAAKTAPAVTEQEATTNEKVLELPRYTLSLLYRLLNVPLHGQQSRARNRVGQLVKDQVNYIEEERVKMIEGFAIKGKDKQPLRKMEGDEEVYDVTPENMAKYRKEFDEFMHEPWVVVITPANKMDFSLIKPLILESKIPLETVDGYAYEEMCTAFEAI